MSMRDGSPINAAILNVMKELPSVVKAKKIELYKGGRGYTALSYDDLIEDVQPLFVKNGITMSVSALDVSVKMVDIPKSDGSMTMNFMVSGTWEVTFSLGSESRTVRAFGYALDTSDKADGKAVTYATKSAIVKCFCIRSEDEEEARPYASQSEPRPSNNRADAPTSFTNKAHWDELAALAKQKGVRPAFCKMVSEYQIELVRLKGLPDAN